MSYHMLEHIYEGKLAAQSCAEIVDTLKVFKGYVFYSPGIDAVVEEASALHAQLDQDPWVLQRAWEQAHDDLRFIRIEFQKGKASMQAVMKQSARYEVMRAFARANSGLGIR